MTSTFIGLLIGIIVAIPGTIMPTRKFLKPKNEKIFYSLSLFPIALIYIGFAYYYGNLEVLHAEIIGVIIFLFFALAGQLIATWILIYGYLIHAVWDICHELFISGIGDAIPWTQVPTGYAAFCLAYDLIIAFYIFKRMALWDTDEVS
ncbi:MAG: DUF6010 family protein [Porticoccaceae bacterium]|nr:hypothetical protein [Pseudomonadales bacterium]MCP5171785.1 hypothetical protein [Pseudomonadales bacterium]